MTAKSFELEAEQQRRFLQELGHALGEYIEGLRGKTQERISEFAAQTFEVISKLEALQSELHEELETVQEGVEAVQNGVEAVQEVGSQLLGRGRN